jgi:ArsR family transcriptional regulator
METSRAVEALAALAQETRLVAYRRLVEAGPEGLSAGALASSLDAPAPTLSFHLKELSRAGLVVGRPDGRFIYYTANFPAMTELVDFLTAHCCHGDPGRCLPVRATTHPTKRPRVAERRAAAPTKTARRRAPRG